MTTERKSAIALAVFGVVFVTGFIATALLAPNASGRFGNDAANVRRFVDADLPIGTGRDRVLAYARQNFQAISWDEAYRCLGARFTAQQSRGRYGSFVVGSANAYFYFDTKDRLTRIRYEGGYSPRELKTPERFDDEMRADFKARFGDFPTTEPSRSGAVFELAKLLFDSNDTPLASTRASTLPAAR